jgi:hypothetical protein
MRFNIAAQQAIRSPLSERFGADIWELDTNANIRCGSFSKPRSRRVSVFEAIVRAVQLHRTGLKSDLLIAPVSIYGRNGWQVFERRTHTGTRKCASFGSWMPKKGLGSGRIFIM